MSIFAIGDIHGYPDKLQSLVNKLPLTSDDRLIFLGDYVDRGPYSRSVMDMLLEIKETHNTVFIRGNHDDMLIDYINGCKVYDRNMWLRYGGMESLLSYGYDSAEPGELIIPADHLRLIEESKYYHLETGFIFVHSGLKPGVPLEQNQRKDLLWTRREFIESRYRWPEGIVVFGHTPFQVPLIEDNKIGIDTGCGYGGPLTAVRLPEIEFFQAE